MRVKPIAVVIVLAAGAAALALMCGCQGGGDRAEAMAAAGSDAPGEDHDHGPDAGDHAQAAHEVHDGEDEEGSHEGADHGGARFEAEAAEADPHAGHDHGESDAADAAGTQEADEHAGHDHGEEAALIRLSERELVECGVTMGVAGPGWLERQVVLPGEVRVNGDRLVHLVPRVPGIVLEVRKTLGDEVMAGEVLAVIESNELADARVDFLAARERLALAEADFEREKNLWEKEITSEQEYLDARSGLTEARIEFRSSEQKLYALGLTQGQVAELTGGDDEVFTRYEVRAPLKGTVVDRHISLGEKVGDDSEIFVVADLSSVWVDLNITQKDFPFVREGVKATVSAGYGVPDAEGVIDYVSPVVGEATRTAVARIVLSNTDGLWRPGLFVSAKLSVPETEIPVIVPRTAAQHLDEEWVVFVEVDGGFEPVPVGLGRGDDSRVEIVSGLRTGQRYVAEGAFECKAKVVTSNIDPHAGHGH
jgi:cobalt-zinc-cadmium efflux system membrane fusion protein